MEEHNQIINALAVKFKKARNINILKPVTIENNYEVENSIFVICKGLMFYGKDRDKAREGEVLFVPGGKMISITYGSGEAHAISKEEFLGNKEAYFQKKQDLNQDQEGFSYVTFDAKAFDSVNFFGSLDIPPFSLGKNQRIRDLIFEINEESYAELPGKDRIINVLTEKLVVELIRFILRKGLFVEQFATNTAYFRDPRLIKLFGYIRENLNNDLSNKVLANVANVSEDYVGQYFKMLTGINPQDYIEYQRMEMAVNLLRTSKRSIREIGKEVGYKDTAYFCRRFKMMFGIPAGKMRRRESLVAA